MQRSSSDRHRPTGSPAAESSGAEAGAFPTTRDAGSIPASALDEAKRAGEGTRILE
jgi:hypothetical protein